MSAGSIFLRLAAANAGGTMPDGLPRLIHDSRPAGQISADACHGHGSRQHLAATSDPGRRRLEADLSFAEVRRVPGSGWTSSWTAPRILELTRHTHHPALQS